MHPIIHIQQGLSPRLGEVESVSALAAQRPQASPTALLGGLLPVVCLSRGLLIPSKRGFTLSLSLQKEASELGDIPASLSNLHGGRILTATTQAEHGQDALSIFALFTCSQHDSNYLETFTESESQAGYSRRGPLEVL